MVHLTFSIFWWRKRLDKDLKMTYLPLKRMGTIDLQWSKPVSQVQRNFTTRHKTKGSVGTSLVQGARSTSVEVPRSNQRCAPSLLEIAETFGMEKTLRSLAQHSSTTTNLTVCHFNHVMFIVWNTSAYWLQQLTLVFAATNFEHGP